MKISIVTAVRNAVATIQDNIDSVDSQNYKNWEHIIIDGLSVDGTCSIVNASCKKNRFFLSEADAGPLDGMNKGAFMATGDIIGFLNADDVFYDELVLDRIVQAFNGADVMGCFGDLVYTNKDDLKKVVRIWREGAYSEKKLLRGWSVAHPTFYVRRSVFEKIGGFDPDYVLQSDFEFVVRFFYASKLKAVYIPSLLVKMRLGGVSNGSWKNIFLQNIANIKALRHHGVPIGFGYPLWRVTNRVFQYCKAKFK